MNNFCVTVIGNIASGKSTLSRLLAENLPAQFIPADDLFHINPFFPMALQERSRYSLSSDLWFLHKRVEILESVPRVLKKQSAIIDSGLPMSWVYAKSRRKSNYYTLDEWELYQDLFFRLTAALTCPQRIVYLQAPKDLLWQRICERGRSFEMELYTQEYLESLQDSLEVFVEKVAAGKRSLSKLPNLGPVIRVDMTREDVREPEVLKAIIAKLKKS